MDVTIPQEVQAEAQAAGAMLATLEALQVTCQAEYDAAGAEVRAIAKRAKDLEAMRTTLKAPILDAGRRIDAFFKEPLDFCSRARKVVEAKMLAHQREQDRIREEAERQAAEAARREREKLEREAAAEREKARKAQEAAEAKARALEEAGKAERAEQMRQQAAERAAAAEAEAQAKAAAAAAMPTAPVVHVAAPAAKGISTRENWKFEIVDPALVPREYLVVDEKAIGQVVRALQSRTNIPGVRVYAEQTIAARTA